MDPAAGEPAGTGADAPVGEELADALERIRKRVEERREAGEIPAGLEEQLDRHYRGMVSQMVSEQRVIAGLKGAVESFDEAPEFSRSRIDYTSRSLVARVFHRVWGKLSARQTEGILQQLREYNSLVRRAVDRMSEVIESLAVHGHPDTERRVATLADRLSELEHRTSRLESRDGARSARSDDV
jgi:vacuolar-type H+-ATPase catalytic subunit A/Vma1